MNGASGAMLTRGECHAHEGGRGELGITCRGEVTVPVGRGVEHCGCVTSASSSSSLVVFV